MLGTSVAPFSSRHSVTSFRSILSVVLPLAITFVEVLACAVSILLIESRTVEIVEHQIHVFPLLSLQVVDNVLVSMHLYFNVSISLAGKGSWLRKLLIVLFIR